MEKKFKFSDRPLMTKIVYGAVIAILCITAVVIAIVAVNSRRDKLPDPGDNSIPGDENKPGPDDNKDPSTDDKEPENNTPTTYIAPTVGQVTKNHSTTIPVFSDTLQEWRIHTGIDISTEEGAEVYAAAAGEVTAIRTDPKMGYCVEVSHGKDIVTVYANLDNEKTANLKVGDKVKAGDVIGYVGDTAMVELADEPHLHFEFLAKGVSVNPLDYISDASKKASLGIETGTSA